MTTPLAGHVPAAAPAACTPRTTARALLAARSELATAPPPGSWLESAVRVLDNQLRPMRAADIVAVAYTLGVAPASAAKSPAQSVNRDLHAAIRSGDTRLRTGRRRGRFCSTLVPPEAENETPRTVAGRLPVGPLEARIEAFGGLGACGIAAATADSDAARRWAETIGRAYHRSRQRGWISLFDADALAVRALGVHPASLWGERWWDANAELDLLASPVDDEFSDDFDDGLTSASVTCGAVHAGVPVAAAG